MFSWDRIVDRTWAPLLVLDRACRITEANAAAHALAGVSSGKLAGQRFCEAFASVPCAHPGADPCIFSRALQGMERRTAPRWRSIVVNGSETSVLVGATSMEPDLPGVFQTTGAVVVTMVPSLFVDEADRKRREMVAAAIHELRHPATIQSITLDLLAAHTGANLSPEASMLMQRMERATAYLTASIDELQNRMLFDLGVMPIRPQVTALRASLEVVAFQHEPLLVRRNQRVVLKIASDLHVWADPAALNHVFANLLVNAHKHSVDGDTFTITARRLDGVGQVEVRVRDHGPGVPAWERRRIFDRFYRGGGAQRHRGAGLGLAIVKSVVEGHGGIVGVSAARGGGAVFWIRLTVSSEAQPAHSLEAAY